MLLNPKEDPDKLKTTSLQRTTFKRYIHSFIHFKIYMYAIVDTYQPQLGYFILKPAVHRFVPPCLEIYFMSQACLAKGGAYVDECVCVYFLHICSVKYNLCKDP